MPESDKKMHGWRSLTVKERAQREHTRPLYRNYYRAPASGRSLPEDACRWLLPWDYYAYPGVTQGIVQLLGGRIGRQSTRNWRLRGCPAPVWVLRTLADEIERRVRLGADLVQRLRREADTRVSRPRGLQIIDPETGLRKHQFRGGHHESRARKAGPDRRGERKI